MSASRGRNRRHTPPPVGELRDRIAEIIAGLRRIDLDYRWLYASGYTKPHAANGQLGAPPEMLVGGAATARHQLIRAAEALDDALDDVLRSAASLVKIETVIDKNATPGGIDPELPEASTAEVRRAEQAQRRRDDRALPGGAPWMNDEVTG